MALPKLGSVSQDAGVQDGTSPGNGIHCLSWRTCLYSYIYIYIDINQRNKGDSGARWLNLRKIAEDIFSTIRTSKMSSTRFDFAAWTKIQLYKTGQCFGQCYFAFAFTSQYTELQLPTGFNTPAWRIIPAKVSTATAISKRTCQRTSKMWQHKHSPSSQTTRGWQLALDHGYLGTEFHRIDKHAKHGVDHQVIFRMSYGYSHQSLSPRNFKDIPISVVLGLSSLTNTLSKMAIICSSPPPPSSLHSQKVAKKSLCTLILPSCWWSFKNKAPLGHPEIITGCSNGTFYTAAGITFHAVVKMKLEDFFVKFNIQMPKEIIDRLNYEKNE